jgi:hypothetical protein
MPRTTLASPHAPMKAKRSPMRHQLRDYLPRRFDEPCIIPLLSGNPEDTYVRAPCTEDTLEEAIDALEDRCNNFKVPADLGYTLHMTEIAEKIEDITGYSIVELFNYHYFGDANVFAKGHSPDDPIVIDDDIETDHISETSCSSDDTVVLSPPDSPHSPVTDSEDTIEEA